MPIDILFPLLFLILSIAFPIIMLILALFILVNANRYLIEKRKSLKKMAAAQKSKDDD